MSSCPICLTTTKDKFIIKTPCNHEICLECFINLRKAKCPLCREDYRGKLPDFFKCHFTENKTQINVFDVNDFPPL